MKKDVHIFFDLDDTMLRTQEEYLQVIDETAELVQNFLGDGQTSLQEIKDKGLEIDIAASLAMGLTKERFPASWVQTYRYFMELVGKRADQKEEERIYTSANQIYTNQFTLYDQVHETLERIQGLDATLHILTAGDNEVQNLRVDDAKLRGYFETVNVVPSKTPEVMKEIIDGKDVSIMIGNSLRSDIHPALENGMDAIHIDQDTWGYDQYQVDKTNERYHAIQKFSELPDLLSKMVSKVNSQPA